jgi:ATPases involved in chromosome partitioning
VGQIGSEEWKKKEGDETMENVDKIAENLNKVKHKVVVLSGKGGVGKSTVASNLATNINGLGKRVGLLDCDIHGPSIPKIFGIDNKKLLSTPDNRIQPFMVNKNLFVVSMGLILEKDRPVIWRGPLKMKAIRQFLEDVSWGELDYLIIDLPPGTGDEPLSIAQLLPTPDGAIIVTTPQDVALISVRRSINFTRALNMPIIGLIENMSGFVCPNCGAVIDIFKKGGGEKAARDMRVKFLGSIPIDPKIVESEDEGTNYIIREFEAVAKRVIEEIERK